MLLNLQSKVPYYTGLDKQNISALSWKYFLTHNSDSFTILGLWVLGLAVSHINEFNCKLMSPEQYF